MNKDFVIVFDNFKECGNPFPAIKSRKRRERNINYVVCDVRKSPVKDKNADIVLCLEVMDHLSNDSNRFEVLIQILRVMSEISIFLFSTPNTNDIIGKYKDLVKDLEYKHHGVWNSKKMEMSLNKQGFSIINTFGTKLDIQFLTPLLRKIPLLLIPIHIANVALEYMPGGKKLNNS